MKFKNFLLNVAVKSEVLQGIGLFMLMIILAKSWARVEGGFLTLRIGPRGWIALVIVFLMLLVGAIKSWMEKETM